MYHNKHRNYENLDNNRHLVADVQGFQITNKPFKGIYFAKRLRPWTDFNKPKEKEINETNFDI